MGGVIKFLNSTIINKFAVAVSILACARTTPGRKPAVHRRPPAPPGASVASPRLAWGGTVLGILVAL